MTDKPVSLGHTLQHVRRYRQLFKQRVGCQHGRALRVHTSDENKDNPKGRQFYELSFVKSFVQDYSNCDASVSTGLWAFNAKNVL